MFQYTLDTNRINKFIENNPTLIQQRRKLAKPDERLASVEFVENFIGGALYSAGERLLNRIHQEIDDAKPQLQKDIEAKELEDCLPSDEKKSDAIVRPELTVEYLKSVGREDLSIW